MLECMAQMLQQMTGDEVIVEAAHMELAGPDIPAGFARCVERGATEVVAFPYMLSPGRHSTHDIPKLVAEAATAFPHVTHRMTGAFGMHHKLAELILERAEVDVVRDMSDADSFACWNSEGVATTCGAACPAGAASCHDRRLQGTT